MALELPAGIIDVLDLTTGDILYGARSSSWRWEILTHAAGVDTLAGVLDGVNDETASLEWSLYQAVKGSGQLDVADLAVAESGKRTIGSVALESVRLRPVLVIEGLPEIPWGVYLLSGAPEKWSGSGRVYHLELLDKATVLDQDQVEVSYTVGTGTPILSALATLIASAGETIIVDAGVTTALAAPRLWPAGTTKLQIANDLLEALNYRSLWMDGVGNFRATPYVLPAARGTTYELLNLPRELVDGETSIYSEEWERDRDVYGVPNKIITVETGSGSGEPLTGLATNTDASSPFSYAARGNRWISRTIDGVEVPAGTTPERQAFLNAKARASLVASSSVQATISVRHLPIPLLAGDVLRFASAPAGIDRRHYVTKASIEARPLGLMSSELQEVVDL